MAIEADIRDGELDAGDGLRPVVTGASGRRLRVRRRSLLAGAGIVALFGVAAAVVAMDRSTPSTAAGDGGAEATTTARAERRDLAVTDEFEGQLGYGEAKSITAGAEGIVTGVAAAGTNVTAGQKLFDLDLQPTVLLYGTVPAFRTLDESSDNGADVKQLEQALVDLGFGASIVVDEDFTGATASAVEKWETALGRAEPDGVVELGDIKFAAGPQRIAEIKAAVGTQVRADSEVLTATSTTKVVVVDVGADTANRLEPSSPVSLELDDGTETTGKITEIDEEAAAAAGGVMGGPVEPTVPVTISFDDPSVATAFDSGTVDVSIERSRVEDALAVPVTALLALAEGGYAVEVLDVGQPNGRRLVAVEPGTYADGFVEVKNTKLRPGDRVVVPR